MVIYTSPPPAFEKLRQRIKYPVVLGCDAMYTGTKVPVHIAGLFCTDRQQAPTSFGADIPTCASSPENLERSSAPL